MPHLHDRRKLRFEHLEGRAMLAGTVTINVGGPPAVRFNLLITGDSAANVIVIHQVPSSSLGPVIQIQGINTKLVVIESVEDTTITEKGTSFTFSANDVLIALGGGNDSLTINNTKFAGTLTIDMGAGNDVLTMSNVQYQGLPLVFTNSLVTKVAQPVDLFQTDAFSLGTGNDVALFSNVTSTGVVIINAGDGRDAVVLNHVVAGTSPEDNLTVDMGPGNFDSLTVTNCTADNAAFRDSGGAHGLLVRLKNHFGFEADSDFQFVI